MSFIIIIIIIIIIIRNRFDLGNYLCLQHLIVTSSIALTTLLFFAESVILFRDEQTKDIRQSNNVEWLPCVQFRLLHDNPHAMDVRQRIQNIRNRCRYSNGL